MRLPSHAVAPFRRSFRAAPEKWLIASVLALVVSLCFSLYLWKQSTSGEEAASRIGAAESTEPIQPIVPIPHLDTRKVALGRKLFFDPRLSHDNQIACQNCHSLQQGGADGRIFSVGSHGTIGTVNAPTVLNSGFNFSQFWDGRVDTLEKQVDEPLQSPTEMAATWPEVIAKLTAIPEYSSTFRTIYRDSIRPDYVKDSIAEFERSLSTPNSRFDRYLLHQANALTPNEEEGYALFKSFGCSSCHQGANVGGNMYQRLGVMAPYFEDRGHITRADRGRFNVTGDPRDMYMFKVPTLRNVALTAPYFHDGSAATLPEAVRQMAKYQLGRHLSEHEVDLIVQFLATLTGEIGQQQL